MIRSAFYSKRRINAAFAFRFLRKNDQCVKAVKVKKSKTYAVVVYLALNRISVSSGRGFIAKSAAVLTEAKLCLKITRHSKPYLQAESL